jgi:cytochrome c oxidase subunit 3
MWLFLYTEIMLFGGLFVLFAVYHYRYALDFAAGGRELDLVRGTLNTGILLTSSFTVVAAIQALRRDSKKSAIILLGVTVLLGMAFLFNKYFEWSHKFEHGIFPGSPALANGPPGQNIFYGLYFTLTGLHALHVLIGSGVLGLCLVLTGNGRITGARINLLENAGLFWHLVDIIWIFLFPLFYLIL